METIIQINYKNCEVEVSMEGIDAKVNFLDIPNHLTEKEFRELTVQIEKAIKAIQTL